MARSLVAKLCSGLVMSAMLAGYLLAPQTVVCKDKKGKKAAPPEPPITAWPPPPQVARIKYIDSFRGDDVKPKQKQGLLERLAGVPEVMAKSWLQKPYGVAIDSKGRAYVTDTYQRLVFVFDFDKKELEYRGDKAPASFKLPIGVALDAADRLFITDSEAHNITAFDQKGNVVDVFGEQQLQRPSGIAIDDPLGRIYVADTKSRRIAIYDLKTFEFVRWMGKSADKLPAKDQTPDDKREDLTPLLAPTNLVVDPDGLLYISDSFGARVLVYDQDGNEVRTIGSLGDGPGRFGRPRGVALDSDGHLYVVDAMGNNFQMFTSDGRPLMPVGRQGMNLPGVFSVPAGIAIDKNDRVIVVDQFNRRIQMFHYITDTEAAKEAANAPAAKDAKQVAEAKKKK